MTVQGSTHMRVGSC